MKSCYELSRLVGLQNMNYTLSKQRRWSCNHPDAWHTINNVCKFAFMNKIPIEMDIQQTAMRFWGHSQGVFIQHKSMKHVCWTNTWAEITHFLMKKSEECWHYHHQPSCAFERTKPWHRTRCWITLRDCKHCSARVNYGNVHSFLITLPMPAPPQRATLSHPSLFIKSFCLEMGIRAQLTFECAGKCW